MTERPIIDAGPGLNFFSIHKERLLFATLGPLSAPECVRDEMLRKARQDSRFAATQRVIDKLSDRLMRWLSDDVTDELEAAVHRLSNLPMVTRLQQSDDLGETMVVAHAAVLAEAGSDVTVLIDDQRGAQMATAERHRLHRRRLLGHPTGSISLISTATVLEKAAGSEYLPDKVAMRDVYQRLRHLDDGLMPIERTRLLGRDVWG